MAWTDLMIERKTDLDRVRRALRRSHVVALLGPRQCGKTTLARQFVSVASPNYFDLEDPLSLARLAELQLAFRALRGLIVIDEIQRRPELFPILRTLADRRPRRIRAPSWTCCYSKAADALASNANGLMRRR